MRSYWSAKKNQYLAPGGVRLQGTWEQLKDSNGNLLEPGDYDLNVYIEKNTNAYVSFSCDPNHIKITLIGQE